MQSFKEHVDRECKNCRHIRYCRGGCPYNAIAPSEGEIRGVDPHCIAYKRIFDEIGDRLNAELFGPCAIEIPVMAPEPGRKTKPGIMSLMQKIATR